MNIKEKKIDKQGPKGWSDRESTVSMLRLERQEMSERLETV